MKINRKMNTISNFLDVFIYFTDDRLIENNYL